MHFNDLLTPWLLLAAVLVPLVAVETWIHSHLYGVGWLLTNDKKSATALYYVILFPGVFVHEFTQWLLAGALNVKINRVTSWPEAQDNGTLRLDFVQIQEAGWLKAAIIGASPLVVGMSLVWLISNQILNFGDFVNALNTGNIKVISPALRDLAGKTDFFIWLYLMFAISNAMLPTPTDRQGWPLVIGAFGLVIAFLIVLGSGEVLFETLTGPVADGIRRLATAFLTVLLIEIPGIVAIGFLEELLERVTRRKFDYSQPARAARVREPGSNLPLHPGTPLPSVYNLSLPVPDPSELSALRAQKRRFSAPARTAQPSPTPSLAQEPPVASQRAPERTLDTTPRREPAEERPATSGPRTAGQVPGLSRGEAEPRRQPPAESPVPWRERASPAAVQPDADDSAPPYRRSLPQPGTRAGISDTDDQPPASDTRSPLLRRTVSPPQARPERSLSYSPLDNEPGLADDQAVDGEAKKPVARARSPLPAVRPVHDQPPPRPYIRPAADEDDSDFDEDEDEELEYIDFDDL